MSPLIPGLRISFADPSTGHADAPASGDFIDRLTEYVYRSRPLSLRSLALAVTGLVLATALRAAFGSVGSHFPLTLYFPAILAVGVLAGTPAAIGMALASVAIVWWAFIPPYLQFAGLKGDNLPLWLLFATASSVTVLVAWLCRAALLRLHDHQRAYRTVARELRHRNKNAMLVIEAIVKKTLRHDPESAEAIVGRLRAVDYANGLLTDPLPQDVSLRTLVEREFAPYGLDRLAAQGPSLDVPPAAARHLVLIIHELATNAAKYGALSVPSGQVAVTWSARAGRLVIRWSEQGGPPVRPPEKAGFGSRLISQSVGSLSGKVDRDFPAQGFCCSLEVMLRAEQRTKLAVARRLS